MLRSVASILVALMMFGVSAICGAWAGERSALLIGNGAYEYTSSLAQPRNDVAAMGRALAALGFDVTVAFDVDLATMDTLISSFRDRSRQADVAIFYYSGHALSSYEASYLMPIDANVTSGDTVSRRVADLDTQAIDLAQLLASLGSERRPMLVLLDASRFHHAQRLLLLSKTRDIKPQGLWEPKVGPNMVIALSAQPQLVDAESLSGQVSNGEHSLFTATLLADLSKKNTNFIDILATAMTKVSTSTGGDQVPWFKSSLTSALILNPGS